MDPIPVSAIKIGHIDDVQELRKSKSSHIPERFIRDTTERPKLDKDIVSLTNNIPVIDLSKFFKGNKDKFLNEISKLTVSCQDGASFR
ncbi:SRG1 [Olea europaea subsp. europaea]|uniref:SRG1 n=1 Tax=Olea europaea subsp. europaea TaxID=158383 RepID=A0A8S0RYT5_OLEEU|nr:SRG1 [Olea europaea subsp. europaea]